MDYTDFRVSASALASILGVFGGNSRFNTLCKVWDKSTFKPTYKLFQKKLSYDWDAETNHLELLGIQNSWRKLTRHVHLSSTQDDLECVNLSSYQLTFQNAFVMNEAKRVKSALRANGLIDAGVVLELCNLIDSITSDHGNYYSVLLILREKRHKLLLDGFGVFVELLNMSAKICYGIQQRASRAYGIQGEAKFIETYNNVRDMGQINKISKMYSKTVTEAMVNEKTTWCIDGRIDGLKSDNIIEIKHRRGKMFDRIPLYELIQIHAYMFLLNKNDATLIQCIQLERLVYSEQKQIYFNAQFWNMVIQKVRVSLEFILALHEQPLSRHAFFLLSNEARDQVMNDHMGNMQELTTEEYIKLIRT
jgi:hypothetical protein